MAQLQRLSRTIDPKTRDWRMINGQREVDSTMVSRVLFLVMLNRNSSPAFPGWGSDLHKLDKITEDIDTQISQEVERCLKPLTDTNLITNLQTAVTVVSGVAVDQWVQVVITFQDTAQRKPDKAVVAVAFG